jgi:glycosyltransferase involved in cell wall biosynthesis
MEDLADRLRDAADRIVCVSHHRSGWSRTLHLVWTALLQRKDYDLAVVDLYSGRAFRWGEIAASLLRALGCPFVFVLRGGGLPGFAKRHPRRVRRCLRKADAVTVPSRFLLEQMRQYRADLRMLPNPLDIPKYDFRLRAAPEPKLIWLRAFQKHYDPTMAPKVLASLLPDFPGLHLSMVGPDKRDGSRQQVERTAKELGVASHLTVPGGVAKRDVPGWLNRGDIFLNTTRVDNAPVSVLEAMACGLCVVSTNVGGIPYLVEHEREALLVPRDDPAAMAHAVRRLLTEPKLAARLSQNGRDKVEQFDWGLILPQWEALLNSLARTPPGARRVDGRLS